MSKKLLAIVAVLALAAPTQGHAIVPSQEQPVAAVRVLDKMTARVAELELPVGSAVEFGTLSIMAKTCRSTLPEETPPESAAFLEIDEAVAGEGVQTVFRGWMFASSPALSAMEHPIYDVWVTGCRDSSDSSTK